MDVRQSLMNYFAAIGAKRGHAFTLRDFNDQVMMNVYAPQERAALGVALNAMVEAGVLNLVSPTEYSLTPEGLQLVAVMRLNSHRRTSGVSS